MDASTYKQSMPAIKQLRVSSFGQSYLVMLLNAALFMLGFALLFSAHTAFYCLGVFILALAMNHAYLIVHECGHGSFLAGRKANELFGNLFALLSFLPFYARRYEHAMHHRYTGSFSEPSTERAMKRFSLLNPVVVVFLSACWKLWVPVFALNEHIMLWKMPFERNMNSKAKAYTIASASTYVVTIALLFIIQGNAAWHSLLLFLPAFYLYMMMVEFFNLPHHLTSPIDDNEDPRPYYEQSHFSRSCSPMPWPIGKFLVLNFNYHIAHHLYPAVHWTRLPEAHNIMSGFDHSLSETEHEWTLNRQMRKQPLRQALSKYFEQQLKTKAA